VPTGRLPKAVTDGTMAGLLGTAAMSVALLVEIRCTENGSKVVDYDASDHVVVAASKVLRYSPRSRLGRAALFQIVHWGYGSLVGIGRVRLGRALPAAAADAAFFSGCQAMALALFPMLGETPPPWRWRAQPLVSSFVLHALYAATVGAVARRRAGAR